MTNEERNALVAEKVDKLRKELEELGVASSFFYRTPGAARSPVAYPLIAETANDVEEARADTRASINRPGMTGTTEFVLS